MRTKKRIHGAPRHPIIAELEKCPHYTQTPPSGATFKAGDKVLYTNPQGVHWLLNVYGFTTDPEAVGDTFIFSDCWWFPVPHRKCQPVTDSLALPPDTLDRSDRCPVRPEHLDY